MSSDEEACDLQTVEDTASTGWPPIPPTVTSADLAREPGFAAAWVPPLDGGVAMAQNGPSSSVRRLRRMMEAILHARDLRAARN